MGGSKVPEHSKFPRKGLRVLKMRFSLAVAVVLVGISVSGLAQQKNTSNKKVKHSAPEEAPKKSAPIVATGSPATAAGANSKELQSLERQSAKGSARSE